MWMADRASGRGSDPGHTGARNFNRRGVGEIVGGCLAGRQSSRLESDNYFPNFPFLSQFDLPSPVFFFLFFK